MEWHIAILIPARDEEVLLPRCLRSVARARRLLPAHVSSDVIVVSDQSSDLTRELAEQMLGQDGLVLGADYGCVGLARMAAAEAALTRTSVPCYRCWLANTDADCEVPASWLLDQLAIAERGVAAVAGIVEVDSFAEHHPRVHRLFRETYRIDADGSHPHVHGANFGLRADAYVQVGGWASLATAEDHDLWKRLGHHGYERLSDSRLQVVTSGRRIGRAPTGFAAALAAHNEVSL